MNSLRITLRDKQIRCGKGSFEYIMPDGETNVFNHAGLIRAGNNLYRSGVKKEWHVSIRRGVAIIEGGKTIPQFFSSWQVAANYSFKGGYFHTYQVLHDIPLLYVDDDCLTWLMNEYRFMADSEEEASQTDKAILRRFLYAFGYRLDRIFPLIKPDELLADLRYARAPPGSDAAMNAENVALPPTFQDFMKRWASTLIEEYSSISLTEDYASDLSTFNRISVSWYDKEIFESLFRITNPRISKPLSHVRGLYVPPVTSGMVNLEFPLTASDIFPEEVFFATQERTVQYLQPNPEHPPYAFSEDETTMEVLNAIYQRPGDHMPPVAEDVFLREFSFPAVAYIYMYTRVYSKLYTILKESLDAIEESTKAQPEIDAFYTFLSNRFKVATYANIQQIMAICGSLIDATIHMEKGLIHPGRVPTEESNPYYAADGTFNANLYTYTVLASAIKRSVGGLGKLFELYIDEENGVKTQEGKALFEELFRPIISGGALFGIYTIGKYRRLTKDIDIKIIMEKDTPENGDEYDILNMQTVEQKERFQRQETHHWILTMINYMWVRINETIFSELAEKKLYAYARALEAIGKMKLKGSDWTTGKGKAKRPLRWGIYADASPTTRLLSNIPVEFDRFLEKRFGFDRHVGTELFNKWLTIHPIQFSLEGTQYIRSYAEYTTEIKKLLERKKRAESEAVRRVINQAIRDVTGGFEKNPEFHAWAKEELSKRKMGLPADFAMQYDSFFPFHTALQKLHIHRPEPIFPNDAKYGIGRFASLFIHKEGDEQDPTKTYGLIDFTFDTHFSTVGAFTKYSGINNYHTRNINGISYGSSLWFIHESVKLNHICNVEIYPGDNEAEKNPLNECAPSRAGRLVKQAKYAERARRVQGFFIGYIDYLLSDDAGATTLKARIAAGAVPPPPTVEAIKALSLEQIEEYLTRAYHTKKLQSEFDTELYAFVTRYNERTHEYMVGAGVQQSMAPRVHRQQRRRYQTRKKLSQGRRARRHSRRRH